VGPPKPLLLASAWLKQLGANKSLRHARLASSQVTKEISHVLVDELQDSSVLQMEIIRLLGKQGNVFAVGDPNQSIYRYGGARMIWMCSRLFLTMSSKAPHLFPPDLCLLASWRQASPLAFKLLKETFPRHQVIQLSQNYRSTPAVVKSAADMVGAKVSPVCLGIGLGC
jgi:superfamily I DNA/RNA helicase